MRAVTEGNSNATERDKCVAVGFLLPHEDSNTSKKCDSNCYIMSCFIRL